MIGKITTNLSTSKVVLQTLADKTKAKYSDCKFSTYENGENKVDTIGLIALLADLKAKNDKFILFINLDSKTKIDNALFLMIKKSIKDSNIAVMFLLQTNCSYYENNHFPLHLGQLFQTSKKIFSWQNETNFINIKTI